MCSTNEIVRNHASIVLYMHPNAFMQQDYLYSEAHYGCAKFAAKLDTFYCLQNMLPEQLLACAVKFSRHVSERQEHMLR